ncbi:phospholipase/Carboxylesterase [Trichoderma gamsii]|uniref:Acyl-protein thioesterase 1 n=1 Tax=Trichoderma gamsii TaxID=398673 RepID=A0A2P4ZAT8_9HYPO|nr:phospholipase/Carboxylesterase [Trichoderma gamsii]PON21423.1 phospholipase/Carboxylesterase [Trichoderma gamsii]
MEKNISISVRPGPDVIEPLAEHNATIIFIHGLGDKPETLHEPIDQWRSNGHLDNIKFVLPHAPIIPFTAKASAYMPAWFDIKVYDGSPDALQTDEDVDGIFASRDYIHSLIEEEISAGILSERIMLAGFSQGGVIAVAAGLTYSQPLAGIVLLSAWLPLAQKFMEYVPEENPNKETPIFQGHGVDDRLVPVGFAKKSREALTAMGFSVSWNVYGRLGHETCEDELDDVEAFIEEKLL